LARRRIRRGDWERRNDEATVGILADKWGNHNYDYYHHRYRPWFYRNG
jgi:hypothetical protein